MDSSACSSVVLVSEAVPVVSVTVVVVLDVCSAVIVENESTVVGKGVVDEPTSLLGKSVVEVSET